MHVIFLLETEIIFFLLTLLCLSHMSSTMEMKTQKNNELTSRHKQNNVQCFPSMIYFNVLRLLSNECFTNKMFIRN